MVALGSRVASALLILVTSAAHAADLPRHSPLGTVFAEPPARVIVRGEPTFPEVVAVRVKVPGYYGGFDTPYRNYYGTSPDTIFSRLPYACRWHALC